MLTSLVCMENIEKNETPSMHLDIMLTVNYVTDNQNWYRMKVSPTPKTERISYIFRLTNVFRNKFCNVGILLNG